MTYCKALVLVAGIFLVWDAMAQAPAAASSDSIAPPDAEIRKILADRIGAENLGSALVVGVIDSKGRRVVSYGSLAKDDKRPLNGDTVFEIGSMTKVFTSLVLMDMVQKGDVAVTDPVSKYLPELGALESVTFKSVAPNGADVYEVKFEHGSTEWRITVEPDGKIAGVGFRKQ